MPHTGNAIIIYLVAQSSFLQTGWHNILSKSYPSGEMSIESKDLPDFRYQVSVAEMQKLTYADLLKWQKHCYAKSWNDALSILDSYFNLNEIFKI